MTEWVQQCDIIPHTHTTSVCTTCFLPIPPQSEYWNKTQWFVFPGENQLRQQTFTSSNTVLLIQLAEQIPLSCLCSWKFKSLPCDLHFMNQIQVSGRRWRCSSLPSWEGVRNLHDAIKIRVRSPALDQSQSFVGVTKKWLWDTYMCHDMRAAPHPDLLFLEFNEGLALLHHINLPARHGVCSLHTCCAWMLQRRKVLRLLRWQ